MLPKYKTKANIFIVLAILSDVMLLSFGQGTYKSWIIVIGTVLFVIGCTFYAKAKGYGGILGFLGLFNIVGLIILVALPDQQKTL